MLFGCALISVVVKVMQLYNLGHFQIEIFVSGSSFENFFQKFIQNVLNVILI